MNKEAQIPMVHRPGCPKPDVFASCKCGANVTCRTCGWGRCQVPCTCMRERLSASKLGAPLV